MVRIPARGLPAPGGLLGVLRSWLHAWSNEVGPAPELPAPEDDRAEAPASGSIRVLVVDDNPVNLTAVSAMMEARGFVPLLAADGAEAVALACELPFDLVLMDLQMPVLDGFGATSAIRRFEQGHGRPAVPVVAYSSLSPGAAILAGHGIDGSLNKPCDDLELDACLLRWCPAYQVPGRGAGPYPSAASVRLPR